MPSVSKDGGINSAISSPPSTPARAHTLASTRLTRTHLRLPGCSSLAQLRVSAAYR